MLYVAMCHDKPNSLELRLATRETHIVWLKGLGERVRISGPFFDETGKTMCGSVVIIEAESIEDAKATFAQDPYAHAGLFASVDIRPWLWVIGAPKV